MFRTRKTGLVTPIFFLLTVPRRFVLPPVLSNAAFVLSLFVPHLSYLGASGMLCFVIVAFSWHLLFLVWFPCVIFSRFHASTEINFFSDYPLCVQFSVCFFFRLHCICVLTHLSLASHKRDIGKQWRHRSVAAERGVWSGSTLLALSSDISAKHFNNKN